MAVGIPFFPTVTLYAACIKRDIRSLCSAHPKRRKSAILPRIKRHLCTFARFIWRFRGQFVAYTPPFSICICAHKQGAAQIKMEKI